MQQHYDVSPDGQYKLPLPLDAWDLEKQRLDKLWRQIAPLQKQYDTLLSHLKSECPHRHIDKRVDKDWTDEDGGWKETEYREVHTCVFCGKRMFDSGWEVRLYRNRPEGKRMDDPWYETPRLKGQKPVLSEITLDWGRRQGREIP